MSQLGDLLFWSAVGALVIFLMSERVEQGSKPYYPRPSDLRRSAATRRLVEISRLQKWVGLWLAWAGMVLAAVVGLGGGDYGIPAFTLLGVGYGLFAYSRFRLTKPALQRRAAARRRRKSAAREPQALN